MQTKRGLVKFARMMDGVSVEAQAKDKARREQAPLERGKPARGPRPRRAVITNARG